MTFKLTYTERVVKEEIPKLPKKVREQIQKNIEKKLTIAPEAFGKPLRKSLKGYRRLRVEDCRVIYRIEEDLVKIFCIQHRSVIYKNFIAKLMGF